MSEGTVGFVRGAYETWNRHGPAAIAPALSEDVELHDAPQLPDAQVWRGREAVIARLQSVADAVGGGSVEFEDVRSTGEEVLVTMIWQLDRASDDVELGRVFHLVRVKDGTIARIRVFLTEEEALGG